MGYSVTTRLSQRRVKRLKIEEEKKVHFKPLFKGTVDGKHFKPLFKGTRDGLHFKPWFKGTVDGLHLKPLLKGTVDGPLQTFV